MKTPNSRLFSQLKQEIEALNPQTISAERKALLQLLIEYIQSKLKGNQEIYLNFICTHNSRRSHFSQIWAQTMADYFHVQGVSCYSGGTEVTALFPMVAETLKNAGFQIKPISNGENPVYKIKYGENIHPIIGFSKKLDDDFNPKNSFAAIMTCDSANEACPVVLGSDKRISLSYEDPKVFDNTPQQVEKYKERSKQIATELFYVFSQIKA